jgi:hypothetical protein
MNIPKGWKLVPVEPTPKMLHDASEVDLEEETPEAYQAYLRAIHRRLVDAAPTSPVQQDDEALEALRELVEARDALVNGETVEQLYAGSRRWRSAASAARALLEKRGEK